MVDITPWQGVGSPPPPGGHSEEFCSECGVGRWIEIGGGPAIDVYHPNIDIAPGPGVDIVSDLEHDILPFHDGHATKMKAIHSLQHLTRDAARQILKECYRVLAPGGKLFLMLGDGDFIVQRLYEDGLFEGWLNCVFHGPNDNDKFGHHKWMYNFKSIGKELMEAGFPVIQHQGYYNAWEFKVLAIKI